MMKHGSPFLATCIWICSIIISIIAAVCLTTTDAAAGPTPPVVGGPGYGLYFDHRRSDIIGLTFPPWVRTSYTLEVWMHRIDAKVYEHTLFEYNEYDHSQQPVIEIDNGIGMSLYYGQSNMCRANTCTGCAYNGANCPRMQSVVEWDFLVLSWETNGTSATSSITRNGQTYSIKGSGQFASNVTQFGCFTFGQEADDFCGQYSRLQSLDAIVDHLVMWDHVRTPEQMAKDAIYIDDSEAGLVFHYDLNDPSASVLHDRSPNNMYASIGWLPAKYQMMSYNTGEKQIPTKPQYVASKAPLIGGGAPVLVFLPISASPGRILANGQPATSSPITTRVTVPLLAYDADGDALNVTISALPTSGRLYQANTTSQINTANASLIADTEVQIKHVDYELDTSIMTASSFTRTQATRFTPLDVFQYTVTDGTTPVTGRVHIIPTTLRDPDVTTPLVIDEDSISLVTLSTVNSNGDMPIVMITSLPTRGQLYQARIGATYNNVEMDVNNLVPITENNTIVNDPNGNVMFVPLANDYDANVYTTFQYKLKLIDTITGDYLLSAPGTVVVRVSPVNDAPSGLPDDLSISESSGIPSTLMIQLNETEPSNEKAPNYFYTVQQFPTFGTLRQVLDVDQLSTNGSRLSDALLPVGIIPIVYNWVSAIRNGSSQYATACAFETDEKGQSLCPTASEVVTSSCISRCQNHDYMMLQMIGPPDWYPSYGDSARTWSPLAADNPNGEFMELQFPFPLYISQVDIYETNKGGAVVRVSSTRNYQGPDTKWFPLWSGPTQSVPDVTNIFSPPLCPYPIASDTIRIDLDTMVPNWQEIDAIKLSGTLQLPNGKVTNTQGKIAYQPADGVHSGVDSGLLDTFTYVVNDCIVTGTAIGTISIYRPAPTFPNATSYRTHSYFQRVSLTAPVDVTSTLSLKHVIANIQNDYVTRINANAIKPVNGSTLFTSIQLQVQDAPTGISMYRSNGNQSLQVADMIDADGSFLYRIPESLASSTVALVFWILVAPPVNSTSAIPVVYRILVHICSASYHMDVGSNVCVRCDALTSSQIESLSIYDRDRLVSVCQKVVTASSSLVAFLYALTTIGMVVVVAFIISVVIFRNHPVIRASSYKFCLLILAGSLIGLIYSYLTIAVGNGTNAMSSTCAALPWLGHMSFLIVFASLFAKTYRIHKIFNTKKIGVTTIPDGELLKFIALMTLGMATWLILWTAIDMVAPVSKSLTTPSLTSFVSESWYRCQSRSWFWEMVPLVYDGLLLLSGIYLSWRVREIPSAFNESKYMAVIIYNLFLLSILVFPLFYFLVRSPDAVLAVESMAVILAVMFTTMTLFVPKWYAMHTGALSGAHTSGINNTNKSRLSSEKNASSATPTKTENHRPSIGRKMSNTTKKLPNLSSGVSSPPIDTPINKTNPQMNRSSMSMSMTSGHVTPSVVVAPHFHDRNMPPPSREPGTGSVSLAPSEVQLLPISERNTAGGLEAESGPTSTSTSAAAAIKRNYI